MKRISFFLALVLTVCSFGLANAQNAITLDNATGLFDPNTISTASVVQFQLRWQVDAGIDTKISGFTNAFQIKSPDGALWDAVSNAFTPAFNALNFDGGKFTPSFGIDGGLTPDTVSFGGFTIFGTGAPPGYNDVSYLIDVTFSDPANDGKVVCLDSVTDYASGTWKWTDATSDIFPTWDGPHCYDLFFVPNLPPDPDEQITLSGSHCAPITYDYTAVDPDGPGVASWSVVSGPGSINGDGLYSYMPSLADVDAGLTVELEVCDGLGACFQWIENLEPTNVAPQFTKGCGTNKVGQTGNDLAIDFDATDVCPGDPKIFSVLDDDGAPATYSFDQATGILTANFAAAYVGCWTVQVSDGVDSSSCQVCWEVSEGAPISIDIEDVACEGDTGVFPGEYVEVDVILNASAFTLGAFDLLIAYDASALSFSGAEAGTLLTDCGWEYFTYRVGADGNCSGGCPTGIVRLVGIAETNDGPNHPDEVCTADGAGKTLATMTFLVTSDWNFGCQSVPISFFWLSCGDNVASDWTGEQMFISAGVYNGDVNIAADIGFPSYAGAPDACLGGYKVEALRAIDFFNGGICIICPGDIDDRGDVNLDGIPYTVADAVMLTNALIYGLSAFPAGYEQASLAASDINADGIPKTVADLVYLIRVILGDAAPYAPDGNLKVTPVTATIDRTAMGVLASDVAISGAHLVLAGQVEPELLASNLEMKYNFDGTNTSVVIVTPVEGESIESAIGALVNIGDAEIISMDLANELGAPVHSNVNVLPTAYELHQNYPNPFNPTTTISFSLPMASEYSLKIYNITGQLVREFVGSAQAGVQTIDVDMSNQASGVYFYKIDAGDYSNTKKMVMLK